MNTLFRLIRSDFRRYMVTGYRRRLFVILFAQGFWASFVYRVAHHLHSWRKVPILGMAVLLLCRVARKWMEIITGISLKAGCCIGEGLHIGNFGHVIVHPGVHLGKNCNLHQGVSIAWGGRGETAGVPTIGDRVFIGANAVVIGNITVGDDVAIGAGAVVTKSVPPRAVVVGNPARISSYRGSFDLIRYDGMEEDPERLESLTRGIGPGQSQLLDGDL